MPTAPALVSGHHVGADVADHHGAGRVDAERRAGLRDHARRGLAAARSSRRCRAGRSARRRTARAARSTVALTAVTCRLGSRPRADAGLVGDDPDRHACAAQPVQAPRGAPSTGRDQRRVAVVRDVVHERAVAVEQDGVRRRRPGRDAAGDVRGRAAACQTAAGWDQRTGQHHGATSARASGPGADPRRGELGGAGRPASAGRGGPRRRPARPAAIAGRPLSDGDVPLAATAGASARSRQPLPVQPASSARRRRCPPARGRWPSGRPAGPGGSRGACPAAARRPVRDQPQREVGVLPVGPREALVEAARRPAAPRAGRPCRR